MGLNHGSLAHVFFLKRPCNKLFNLLYTERQNQDYIGTHRTI